MAWLNENEREALLEEYRHLRDATWQRAHTTLLVHSILITGSLVIAFPILGRGVPIISLILTLFSLIMQITSVKVDDIDFDRRHEIERKLGIEGPWKTYKSRMEGKLWFRIRSNLWYGLFTILIGIYSFLIFHRRFLLTTIILVGFGAVLVKEIYFHIKREIEKSVKKEGN